MVFRFATVDDIAQIQVVRHSVNENKLSNPTLVTDEDCVDFITKRGKGWVCETDGKIVGFCIVDLTRNNVWALFIEPQYEAKGIGKKLQNAMLAWYFKQTNETLWLGTAPDTRAETFYEKTGWANVGIVNKDEVKFEMSFENWTLKNKAI